MRCSKVPAQSLTQRAQSTSLLLGVHKTGNATLTPRFTPTSQMPRKALGGHPGLPGPTSNTIPTHTHTHRLAHRVSPSVSAPAKSLSLAPQCAGQRSPAPLDSLHSHLGPLAAVRAQSSREGSSGSRTASPGWCQLAWGERIGTSGVQTTSIQHSWGWEGAGW